MLVLVFIQHNTPVVYGPFNSPEKLEEFAVVNFGTWCKEPLQQKQENLHHPLKAYSIFVRTLIRGT